MARAAATDSCSCRHRERSRRTRTCSKPFHGARQMHRESNNKGQTERNPLVMVEEGCGVVVEGRGRRKKRVVLVLVIDQFIILIELLLLVQLT